MELDVFAGQEKSELSMIEVARAILETRGRDNEMYFNDLVNEIQNYLENRMLISAMLCHSFIQI